MIHLGKCLAAVHRGTDFSDSPRGHNKVKIQNSTLETVKMRLSILTSSGTEVSPVIIIPNGSCFVDKPFLEGNIDFFLLYLGIAHVAKDGCIDCSRLMKHLNDCYRCFDVYCGTLQEFFLEKEILSRQKTV